MTLCLSHRSAVAYLREAGASSLRLAPLQGRRLPSLVPRSEEVGRLGHAGCGFLERPVHLLVGDASERRLLEGVVCHAAPVRTAPRFVLEAPDGLLVEGPGLCLLHGARKLPLPRLAELCLEFCGGYRLYPDDPRGFVDCDPLITRAQLVRFARVMKGAKGARALGRTLAYVRDDARSPMEAVVVLLLCLPPRFGGYGLPMPLLNHRVDIDRSGRKASANGYYVCDMFWVRGPIGRGVRQRPCPYGGRVASLGMRPDATDWPRSG